MEIDGKGGASLYELGSVPGQINRASRVVLNEDLWCLLAGIWYQMPSVSGLMSFYSLRGISFFTVGRANQSSPRSVDHPYR
jgi:hypothetical protein